MWRVRMLSEYRSTSVFSALAAQLMEARASLEPTAVVLRMGQDELRHAEVCGEALVALGTEGRIDEPVAVSALARHAGCTPEERALRNVIYGCALSEIVNTARFVDMLDSMSDLFLKDITRQLLSDEVLHGQFGFLYLEEWRDWLEVHPEVLASLARYLRHAFDGGGDRPRAGALRDRSGEGVEGAGALARCALEMIGQEGRRVGRI